jgi:SH3 domain-containing YSC84-like protein 1
MSPMPLPDRGAHIHSGTNAWLTAVFLAGVITCLPPPVLAEEAGATPSGSEAAERESAAYSRNLQAVVAVLQQVAALPDAEKQILRTELQDAQGIAVFPGLIKAGMVFANLYGRGVLSYREFGKDWSRPIFLTVHGSSWGPQVGAQWIDVLVVFHTARSVESFLAGNLSVALEMLLAPVARQTASGPDGAPEIMTYIFRRGLLMGQSIDAFSVTIDETANRALYGEAMKAAGTTKGVRLGPRWPPFVKQYVDQVTILSGQPAPMAYPSQDPNAAPE